MTRRDDWSGPLGPDAGNGALSALAATGFGTLLAASQ